MKALQIKTLAHPSKQGISDIPAPIPKDGEVLVDVYASGLNFFDILQAQGKYQRKPPLPFVLGAEFAGYIADNSPIPAGCKFKRGDRVCGVGQGAYAEQIAIVPTQLLPAPSNLTHEQACGITTYTTSYEALVGRGKAQPGEWVLVHAGAGGVGLAACQIAKYLGCKVIATAGSQAKRDICVSKGGADYTIDYTKDGWQQEVKKITGGHGVDVVYDPVGMLIPSLKCVAWNSRLVVVGFAGGTWENVPANLVLLKQCSIVGLHWGSTKIHQPSRYYEVLDIVQGLVAEGKLVPQVYEPLYNGLGDVTRALGDLEERKTWGKAVVRIRDEERKAKL